MKIPQYLKNNKYLIIENLITDYAYEWLLELEEISKTITNVQLDKNNNCIHCNFQKKMRISCVHQENGEYLG